MPCHAQRVAIRQLLPGWIGTDMEGECRGKVRLERNGEGEKGDMYATCIHTSVSGPIEVTENKKII